MPKQEASAIGWKDALSDYISKITIGKHMQLATGHYVHYDKSDIIADKAKAFLKDIKQNLELALLSQKS